MPEDTPSQPRSVKESLTEEVGEIAKEAVRKASPLSIGLAVVVFSIVGCAGLFLHFNKETIIRLFEVAHSVEHLHADHERCKAEGVALRDENKALRVEMVALKLEVKDLRGEVADLKTRVAVN